jgi:hypothetical protein
MCATDLTLQEYDFDYDDDDEEMDDVAGDVENQYYKAKGESFLRAFGTAASCGGFVRLEVAARSPLRPSPAVLDLALTCSTQRGRCRGSSQGISGDSR